MFNSKKKFEKMANRLWTGSELLKAAVAGDQDTLTLMATGKVADEDGLWFALQTFVIVAIGTLKLSKGFVLQRGIFLRKLRLLFGLVSKLP